MYNWHLQVNAWGRERGEMVSLMKFPCNLPLQIRAEDQLCLPVPT